MKRSPIVVIALLVMVILILPIGTLYAAERSGNGIQGTYFSIESTKPFDLDSGTQGHAIFLPLVISGETPVAPTNTATITLTPSTTNTPTPTTSITPTPIPDVIINYIEPGDHGEEYVRVKNRTTVPVVLTGWTINSQEKNKTYTFKEFYLNPNDAVRVWTKSGIDSEKNLYWGSSKEIWDDDDDCGRLGDEFGALVNWYCYSDTTPTPPTPTSQPIPDVIINYVDPGSYRQEYVRVKNRTTGKVDLTGWTIKSEESELIFTFPDFKLKPNAMVRVWSQSGPNGEEDLYWGAWTEVWDDKSDCARLGNEDDEFVDWYCYP